MQKSMVSMNSRLADFSCIDQLTFHMFSVVNSVVHYCSDWEYLWMGCSGK
jgi:hypothetical protein